MKPAEDRYQIVRRLGAGGMGVVYLANDTLLKREVAIKTIKTPEGKDTQVRRDAVQRLIREARAVANLKHPHIVAVYDVNPDKNSPSIIMEYIRGKTLAEATTLGIPAEVSFVVRVLKECGGALDYAYSRGRVHRDFKPGNVMVDEAGSVHIMDFGIAKLLDSETDPWNVKVMGTPEYMSPEHIQDKRPLDGRSDQYSLAVVGYELLTGRRVFDFDLPVQLLFKALGEAPPPASERNPDLPQTVDAVLGRALAKSPRDRYGSCMEFITELETRLLLPVDVGPPRLSQDAIPTVTIPALIVKNGPKVGDVRMNEIEDGELLQPLSDIDKAAQHFDRAGSESAS